MTSAPEYYGGMRLTPRLKRAEVLHDHVVRVSYAGGLTAEVDLGYVLELGPVFEPLRDPAFFRQLKASREANTITWPNGADLAPETLYAAAQEAARTIIR